MTGRHKRNTRKVNGIVLLDKPTGLSSNEALQKVKRLFNAAKAGHTGSLDRLASGLLPICMGEATKLSGFLLNADKRYRATFALGARTTTGDAEGEVLAGSGKLPTSERQVQKVMENFRGAIQQVPPMHSAIKHRGKRLYQLAHQGIVVEREPRTVQIYTLELLHFTPQAIEVEVHCSKGTYVRTLAEDIGEQLGCGGHVSALRRTGAGPFTAEQMVGLDRLQTLAEPDPGALDDLLLPMETAIAQWPNVRLSDAVAYYLRQGQPVLVPHAPAQGYVGLYAEATGFLGVGEILDDGRVAPKRLVGS